MLKPSKAATRRPARRLSFFAVSRGWVGARRRPPQCGLASVGYPYAEALCTARILFCGQMGEGGGRGLAGQPSDTV